MTEQERQDFVTAYRYYEKHKRAQTDEEWQDAADEIAIRYEKHKTKLAKKLLIAAYESLGKESNK